MKMTSGKRKQERQSSALDRLTASAFTGSAAQRRCIAAAVDGVVDAVAASAQWTERRDREIATLRQRTGRIHES